MFTQPGATPGSDLHIAGARSHQAPNTKPVDPTGEAATREIVNVGHLKRALKGVYELVKHRYGRAQVPTEAAYDVYRVLAAIEAAIARRDLSFMPDQRGWTTRRLALSKIAKAGVRAELAAHPVVVSPRFLGEQLGLLDAERDAVRFLDAEAVDLTAEAAVSKRRAKDAARKRAARGSVTKCDALARAREAHPAASPATLYRYARKLKDASNG